MGKITFRMAAKTNVGLVRTNNEDNFQAASDLCSAQMIWINNEECELGEKGALLVVADGMGGMNAGEVASEIAIATVKEWFAPDRITPEVTASRFTIEKFMNDAVVAADSRIKQEGHLHKESRGMGTTIVIGWIYDGKLYVSWCGDSRAYVYNPQTGLHQLSVDHSYVQTLVEQKKITREDAFDYPESNIITRSLCDAAPKARPESLLNPYVLCDNDIVMLCTDGLSGMIRDNEMEDVIRRFEHDMDKLSDQLIAAALNAAGSDNVTLCLCQVLSGGQTPDASVFDETERRLNGESKRVVHDSNKIGNTITPATDHVKDGFWKKYKTAVACAAAAVVVAAVAFGAFYLGKSSEAQPQQTATPADTARVEPKDTANATNSQSQSQASAPTGAAASIGSSISGVMQPGAKPDKPVKKPDGSNADELTPATEIYVVTLGANDMTWAIVSKKYDNIPVEKLERLNPKVTPKKGVKVRIIKNAKHEG